MKEYRILRDYLFRGKSVKDSNWVYGYYSYYKSEVDGEEYYYIRNLNILDTLVIKESIGQFTELYDVDNKPIYEGDILEEQGHFVNWERKVYVDVNWKTNYSCWLRGAYTRLTPKNIREYKAKVVGNIYDNPELLEDK